MSKKIIYLLSLLMALSLVFASCKKNGPTDPGGNIDNGFDNDPTTETGLAPDAGWLEDNSKTPIKNAEIPNFQTTGGVAYFRNPVVVVMGAKKNHVAVFAEKRYLSAGSANDIGVDGKTATDIVCIISKDAGKTWGVPQIVGRTSEAKSDGSDAVASPVVFKVEANKVVVVASAGAGLSRISQDYDSRDPKSKLNYAVGTYDETSGFNWESGWQDMTDSIKTVVDKYKNGNNGLTYSQFAVHSGRGVVDASKNLYLAVTIADQGRNGDDHEAMGNIIFKAPFNSGNLTWTEVVNNGSAVKFDTTGSGKTGYSKFKESRIIAAENNASSASQVQYIAVGNPYTSPANNHIGHGSQIAGAPANTIPGSEGSPSYLVVSNWQGQNSYDPNTYDMTTGNPQRLFAHVKTRNDSITMYGLQDANFAQDGTKTYTVVLHPDDNSTLAKSSSMDVLGDGTIIMVAEQSGSEKAYKVVFKRFTQKFLATELGL